MKRNIILENLRLAREIISAAPEEQISLEFFKRTTPCGTLYCVAGWLSVSPEFSGIMTLKPVQDPWKNTSGSVLFQLIEVDSPFPPSRATSMSWLDNHFGPNAFVRLFEVYGEGFFDDLYPGVGDPGYKRPTDRQLALYRIDRQIATVNEEHDLTIENLHPKAARRPVTA